MGEFWRMVWADQFVTCWAIWAVLGLAMATHLPAPLCWIGIAVLILSEIALLRQLLDARSFFEQRGGEIVTLMHRVLGLTEPLALTNDDHRLLDTIEHKPPVSPQAMRTTGWTVPKRAAPLERFPRPKP